MFPNNNESGVDAFNIPLQIFGRHSEKFWGGLGRTVALSALLEDRLRTLLQVATTSDQGAFARESGTEVVKILARQTKGILEWAEFQTYLEGCTAALNSRNKYAHSLWPAQPWEDHLFAHSLGRDGKRNAEVLSYQKLQESIDELVALILDIEPWLMLAPSIPPDISNASP